MLRLAAGTAMLAVAMAGGACTRPPEQRPPEHSFAVRADIVLPPEIEVIEARVPQHATLDSLLREYQFAPELISAAVDSAASVFNLRHLRADRPYRLVRSLDGWLREFVYEIDADRFLRIVNPDRSRPEVLDAEVLPFEKEIEVAAVRGEIDSSHPSLIAATDAVGEKLELAMALADIFGGQIDFDSDLQPGDGFEVLFEKASRAGEFAGYGDILGARFVTDGKEYQAFRWTDPATGKSAYYDESGRSLKRFFLMSPLKFEPRITSRFTRSRLHPVFHTRRAHLGVDYGARHGAPVVAVAAGTVVSAGWAGGGGKQIRLRHAGGFESYYLHLSSFASGIRPGVHVVQGQFIGRVGATGTATGPHLDFRLRKNGVFVDPVRERRRQPPGHPIPPEHLTAFQGARDELLVQISATLAEIPRLNPDAARALEQ
jgi:murein DD-endopeptidase MepM/ murein hydrolase activator NlpD